MKSRVKRLGLVCLIALVSFGAASAASAQSELALSIHRDFGYGGFDNRIEGLFSLRAEGPEDLVNVDFYIDDELIASVDQAPFRIQFSTNTYAPGEHDLYAIGLTSSGEELLSNTIVRVFLSKEESGQAVTSILIPMLGVILVLFVVSAVIPTFFSRKGKVGEYGMLGGAVCPKCHLPFSLSFWGFNLFTGKLQRCPHCGKWSLVRRARPDALAAAEARYRGEEAKPGFGETAEQRTRRQIDDSRYD